MYIKNINIKINIKKKEKNRRNKINMIMIMIIMKYNNNKKKIYNEYKIYIINQAESMTIEAQNALLKTLEEPPEYAIIILITSNKESLLDTIKSRCEIIKFLPISIVDLNNYLITKGIDKNRAQLLSTFARGSIEKAIELSESADFAIMRDEIQTYIEIPTFRDQTMWQKWIEINVLLVASV